MDKLSKTLLMAILSLIVINILIYGAVYMRLWYKTTGLTVVFLYIGFTYIDNTKRERIKSFYEVYNE